MIDLMENKVVAPLILKQYELGRSEGMQAGLQAGMQTGMQDLLLDQLTEKFGPVPEWAAKRVQAASAAELHTWEKRVLHSDSLEDTLR